VEQRPIRYAYPICEQKRRRTEGRNQDSSFILHNSALTAVFTDETHWWALIPAGIIGLIGAAVLWDGLFMTTLQLLGKLWPLALIIAGLAILFEKKRLETRD